MWMASFKFTFSTHDSARITLPVKQYTLSPDKDHDGWTLLFAHSTGGHKEQWEPVIQKLLNQETVDKPPHVQEAWSFECPSHGEGAKINEQYLKRRPEGFLVEEWAIAIAQFIKSKDFNPHRTIAIGHSSGSSAFILATEYFPVNNPVFAALILIEPVLISRRTHEANKEAMNNIRRMLFRSILRRRNVWQSREEAFQWMMKRLPWKGWDHRVVRLYCEHGLRDVLSNGNVTVTLCCDKKHEALAYCEESHPASMKQFCIISKEVPVHMIFGEIIDLVPRFQREAMMDPSEGGTIASVQTIPGAGHLVSQEKPDAVAQAVFTVLSEPKSASVPAKL